ncbi:MAG: shikimate kinase [Rhodopila sp.]
MPASHHIFLVGVSRVGKSAGGAYLATLRGHQFYDLDREVEAFFGRPIERLQQDFRSIDGFRATAANVLKDRVRLGAEPTSPTSELERAEAQPGRPGRY